LAGYRADRQSPGGHHSCRRADVPGVWVAGNLASVQAQVIIAAAAGLAAGAAINLDLVLEEAGQVAEHVGA
jgi:thioredoxin reductase